MNKEKDISILRNLSEKYAEIACSDLQNKRRELWRKNNSLEKNAGPLIIIQNFGSWSEFMRHEFSDEKMECRDLFFKNHEKKLKILLWQNGHNDDTVEEPWINQGASHIFTPEGPWGLKVQHINPEESGGAFKEIHPIQDWSELDQMTIPHHKIDELKTKENYDKINNAVGDILEVNLDRSPLMMNHNGSISDPLGHFRGIENLMFDMYDNPEKLKQILEFLRDGTLINQQEGEEAGDFSLTACGDYSLAYFDDGKDPKANSFGAKRSDLLCFMQAQEYTMFSPEQHDEFMLQYQIPIMEKFKYVTYGCCEDLTDKINILRQIKNLRMIGVTPSANVAKCAEQIGDQYVISYRPNPAEMVCCGFDESKIRRIIGNALEIFKANNCIVHIYLKDIETLEGEWDRLGKWSDIVRSEIDKVW